MVRGLSYFNLKIIKLLYLMLADEVEDEDVTEVLGEAAWSRARSEALL